MIPFAICRYEGHGRCRVLLVFSAASKADAEQAAREALPAEEHALIFALEWRGP